MGWLLPHRCEPRRTAIPRALHALGMSRSPFYRRLRQLRLEPSALLP